MQDVKPETICHIENALHLKLYPDQVKYLTGEISRPDYNKVRASGKTTAYCIKLALSWGQPLDLMEVHIFSDAYYSGLRGDAALRYSRHYFLHRFMDIRETLYKYGLEVREMKHLKIHV